MPVTLKDVAAELGISLRTVSRALSGKGYVSGEIRQKVYAAIEMLDYKPNKLAQALVLNKKYRIAVIYPRLESVFWPEIENGFKLAQEELADFGVRLDFYHFGKYDRKEELQMILYRLAGENFDGIILSPVEGDELTSSIKDFADRGIPIITFATDAPQSKRICYVGPDAVKLGRMGAEIMGWLVKGRGDVAVLSAAPVRQILDRVAGFQEKIGEDYPDIRVQGIYDFNQDGDWLYQITRELIKNENLAGLFVTNVDVFHAARAVCDQDRGSLIKLVGFDLCTPTREYLQSGIIDAVIFQDPVVQSYNSVEIMYEILHTGQPPQQELCFTNAYLVTRESIRL